MISSMFDHLDGKIVERRKKMILFEKELLNENE